MKENKKERKRPIIGITCGDLNGIGMEVALKALNDTRVLKHLTPVLLCSSKVVSFYRKHLKLDNFTYFHTEDIRTLNPKKVNVLNLWEDIIEIQPGIASKDLSVYTRQSLAKSCELLKENEIAAVVTAPLNKQLVNNEEFQFPGHTEYFTQAFGVEDSLMFMVEENLRVGLVTGHLPLHQVAPAITEEKVIAKAKMMIASLSRDFGIKKPKVAVLALNPHAGEEGLLGSEENDTIIPAIENLKQSGNLVFGPFPADGFFGSNQHQQFDGVLAMYHDQGLIPFKYMAFGNGVNFTAGLPFVRTSPDHGTAFPIAGKGLADASSFRHALFCAADIAKRRDD